MGDADQAEVVEQYRPVVNSALAYLLILKQLLSILYGFTVGKWKSFPSVSSGHRNIRSKTKNCISL
jgi:hypothetical protein